GILLGVRRRSLLISGMCCISTVLILGGILGRLRCPVTFGWMLMGLGRWLILLLLSGRRGWIWLLLFCLFLWILLFWSLWLGLFLLCRLPFGLAFGIAPITPRLR